MTPAMPTAAQLRVGDEFRQAGASGGSMFPLLKVTDPPQECDGSFGTPGELMIGTQMVDGFGRPIEHGGRAVYFMPDRPVWIVYRKNREA